MAPMYYRRANAAMIVYDITRENTFEEAKEWVRGQSSGRWISKCGFGVGLVGVKHTRVYCQFDFLLLQSWRVKWTLN